ncbi:MAG: DUF4271 domain-containing protein [Chitinophagales bacterium]
MKHLFLHILCCFFIGTVFSQSIDDTLVQQIDLSSIDTLEADVLSFSDVEQNVFIDKISTLQATSLSSFVLFGSLLLMFLIGVVLLENSRQQMRAIRQSLFNVNLSMQHARTARRNNRVYLWGYFVSFFLLFSLSVYLSLDVFFTTKISFYTIAMISAAFFFLDYISYIVMGVLGKKEETSFVVRYNVFVQFIVGFWVFLLFCFFLSFGVAPYKVWIAWILIAFIAFFFLFKEVRLFQVILAERINFSVFHFLLYICTFKILPVVVLCKVMFNLV